MDERKEVKPTMLWCKPDQMEDAAKLAGWLGYKRADQSSPRFYDYTGISMNDVILGAIKKQSDHLDSIEALVLTIVEYIDTQEVNDGGWDLPDGIKEAMKNLKDSKD